MPKKTKAIVKKNRLVQSMAAEANLTTTEKGALTHRSTLSKVLDFYYHAPAKRGQDNVPLFSAAYGEDKRLALKALFYLRDIRQGKGERKTFRDCLEYLKVYDKKVFQQLIKYVAEYGRWDDILAFVDDPEVVSTIGGQLADDGLDSIHGKPVSLLGKWMPSANTSGKGSVAKANRKLAARWAKALGWTPAQYRKALSRLRKSINIVERQMSQKAWGSIEYPHVPGMAMKKYRRSFTRQDHDRFEAYIEAALKGDVKIQSSVVYPHDIARIVMNGTSLEDQKVMDAMWSQLPNYFGDEDHRALVVCDTSGSMFQLNPLGQGTYPIHVSVSLALYCAERNRGAFQGYFITFSEEPEIQFINGDTLATKLHSLSQAAWGGTTNLQKVFTYILAMAQANKVPIEDMPTNIVIISDMQFDGTATGLTNHEAIQAKYQEAGYEMPTVTYWQVASRGLQAPVTKSKHGVFLVSGFSAETIGKVLQAKATSPEGLMLEVLESPRYAFVDNLGL